MIVEPNVVGHYSEIAEFLNYWEVLKLLIVNIFDFWIELMNELFVGFVRFECHLFVIINNVVSVRKYLFSHEFLDSFGSWRPRQI
jgi:hypothetical protein